MPTTIYVSYSELDAFRQCALKWALGYRAQWSKQQDEGSPLHRGSAWHAVLETHYRVIQVWRKGAAGGFLESPNRAKTQEILEHAIAACWAAGHFGDVKTGEVSEQQELLAWMYEGYCEQYGIDLEWRILNVEREGAVWLPTDRGGRSRFKLRYKIDLVVHDLTTGQLKIVDHKSAANFSRQAEIDIDDQFGLYDWAWIRETGRTPASIVRSDARTQRNKSPMRLEDRFRRVQTHRSTKELANIAQDAYLAARAAYQLGVAFSAPAPDRCTWRCDFLEAHIALRKGLGKTEVVLRDFGFTQRAVKHPQYESEPS